jgi:hypothetical protein
MSDRKSDRSRGGGVDMEAWWEERDLGEKIVLGILLGLLIIGLVFLCGWVVMLLWNWLMPELFGLKRVGYWQAWGLLALCTILFKGMPSGSGGGGKSDRKRKRKLRQYIREEQAARGGEA